MLPLSGTSHNGRTPVSTRICEHAAMASRALDLLFRWVDPQLNYGRQQIARLVERCAGARTVLDIGAGTGADLTNVRTVLPQAQLVGFDCAARSLGLLRARGIEAHELDIEHQPFPLAAGTADLVIANQILEHAKEIYWIFDQISRVVATGGHLIVGVPNLASLHNRLLLACGRQPTPIRSASAHVRGFTKPDLLDFVDSCFPGGWQLVDYRGGNFYPFPPAIARPLARLLPSLAWSNFYLFRKVRPYDGEFLAYPRLHDLETNFFVGPHPAPAA